MSTSGSHLPAWQADDHTPYVQKFLGDAGVAPALKELYLSIIPEKNLPRFAALVNAGAITPDSICEKYPLAGAREQVMNMREPERTAWLTTLFSQTSEISNAITVKALSGNGLNFNMRNVPAHGQAGMHDMQFVPFLQGYCSKDIYAIAEICPALLAQTVQANSRTQPLLHTLEFTSPFTTAQLDKLEDVCGNSDFLNIRDAAGRTLFFNLVSNMAYRDQINMVEVAAWMLKRNPDLVHMQDNLDFTPLDRYVLMTGPSRVDPADSAMLRLLVSAGADFNRQLAPKFNLAAEIEKRNDPMTNKLRLLKRPPAP